MNKDPLVIVTRKLPDSIESRMAELFNVRLNPTDQPLSETDLKEAVSAADILVPTVTDKLTADILSHASSHLKLIANFGAGVDNIDLDAATDAHITVTNTPGVLTEDTADMTMALMLAVPRRLLEGAIFLNDPANNWGGWSPTWMLGQRLNGKALGIVGMGRIGQAVARRAKAFGFKINYHNRRRVAQETEKELDATYWENLDQMLTRMDVISVNCPSTPATYHLLSARRLNLLKPTAFIINTARGDIIDEEALATIIENGAIAGAGLDVFEHEPQIDKRLLHNERVVALPHMSSATLESRIDMGEKVMINIKAFVDNHTPPDRVFPLTRPAK
jgi:glyoxylate reductase